MTGTDCINNRRGRQLGKRDASGPGNGKDWPGWGRREIDGTHKGAGPGAQWA